MNYTDRYIQFRDEIWAEFENIVKRGVVLSEITEVCYPRGTKVKGLSVTTEGDSWFYAKAIIPNPDYKLHEGKDLIVATGKVTFVDLKGKHHHLEPNILDIDWLCELLDNRKPIEK